MTQQQTTALARALERAHANGLQVRGHGTVKLDGARFLAIDSTTLPNVWHIVVIREGLWSATAKPQVWAALPHRALAHEALKPSARTDASERWA